MCLRDDLFVEPYESVNGSLSDLQRGKVREKVITNKETHENPVINGSLVASGRRTEEEKTRVLYIRCDASTSSPPSQMEKVAHQFEALSPNTIRL